VRFRQSPMCIGELLVDLQRTAKLERGFLKLLVFQQGFAASDVLGFGFFGGRARAEADSGGNDSDEKQRKGRDLSAALSCHYGRSPYRAATQTELGVTTLGLGHCGDGLRRRAKLRKVADSEVNKVSKNVTRTHWASQR